MDLDKALDTIVKFDYLKVFKDLRKLDGQALDPNQGTFPCYEANI